MATFMESCRCKGSRPQGVVGRRFVSRPDIVGRLLRDRRVARFIIAPTGYGKSTVAFEYANIVFGFKRMFWVRCASPCFLRDLDAGELLPSLIAADPDARLVVCDDVPLLDDARAQSFDAFIDGALERGCEVIVTSSPSADTFSHMQRDGMLLDGVDLLLSDDELCVAASGGRLDAMAVRELPPSKRAPSLIWHDEGAKVLLDGAAAEALTADILTAAFILLVLGGGSADDLASFFSDERAGEAWDFLAPRYPYLGMDQRTASYAPMDAGIGQLAASFSGKVAEMARSTVQQARDALIARLADILLERGCGQRACELMASFAPKPVAAAWLTRSCRRLVRRAQAQPISALYDAIRRSASGYLDQLSLCKCWSALLMGEGEQLTSFAGRVVRSSSATVPEKAMAHSLLLMSGPEGRQPRTLRKLGQLMDAAEGAREEADALCAGALVIGRVCRHAEEGPLACLRAWESESHASDPAEGEAREALLLAAAWILRSIAAGMGDLSGIESDPQAHRALMRMGAFCSHEAARDASDGRWSWFALNAASALEEAAARIAALAPFMPHEDVRALVWQMEASLAEQRERDRAAAQAEEADRSEYERTHPDPFRRDPVRTVDSAPIASIPMLTVNLFGGMEVRIGGELIAPGYLRRMKVKTLLALLVIHRGREIPRDALAEMLWPESPLSAYRNNFYSIWSQLKRSLQFEGTCPYLVRSQTGCSLDARLVSSDVYEYDRICRSLLFGTDAAEDWERLYSCICNDYAGKLMPCEKENKTIRSLRDHYHAQLVDGLIATTGRLIGMDESRGAVWFAREALRREAKREDVYIALMEAQIASDQRAAALETYFECRRFLNEDLGIDPSMRLVGLYRSIIETEDIL